MKNRGGGRRAAIIVYNCRPISLLYSQMNACDLQFCYNLLHV